MKYKIIPTIISKNQEEIDSLLNKYSKFFKHFQLDVMDGKFVDNKSNWFDFKLNKNFTYEAHLMVENPEKWVYENYKNFNILIANFEKVNDPLKLIKFVHSKKKKIGFSLNPETSLMHIMPFLKELDLVLLLTVEPGKYGAEFIPSILEKIKMLRMDFKKDIEVDGGININTIKLCRNSGANLFAVGSYFKNSQDLKNDKKKLEKALGK